MRTMPPSAVSASTPSAWSCSSGMRCLLWSPGDGIGGPASTSMPLVPGRPPRPQATRKWGSSLGISVSSCRYVRWRTTSMTPSTAAVSPTATGISDRRSTCPLSVTTPSRTSTVTSGGSVPTTPRRTSVTTCSAMAKSGRRNTLSRSRRDTMPTNRPSSSTTGSRLTSAESISLAPSTTEVRAMIVTAGSVISSRAVAAAAFSRAARCRAPSKRYPIPGWPASSTLCSRSASGTTLTPRSASRSTISLNDACSPTHATSVVITSATVHRLIAILLAGSLCRLPGPAPGSGASGAGVLGENLAQPLHEPQRGIALALPHVASEDQARGAGLHRLARLVEHRLLAARDENQRPVGRPDDSLHRLLAGDLDVVRGPHPRALLGLREVHLDHVGADLARRTGGVVHGVEGVLPALRVDGRAPRVGPHDQRHPVPLRVLADDPELREVLVLHGRTDIHRVADRVGAQPHRVGDAAVHR